MASITNVKICDGYDGLIKTSNNAAITSTPVQLTDGLGNNLPIQVGTNSTIFSQTVDFTNATVIGAAGDKGEKGDQGVQGVTGPTGPAGAKGDKGDAGIASNGYYASFYDNTDQVISAIDTPQVVQIANTTLSNGVSLIGPKVVIANAGVYDMRVTLQISNPNNSIAQVKAWLRFNGVDYPNSAHYVSLAPRKSSTEPFEVVTTFGFVGESLNANDYVEIYWQSDTSLVQLEAVQGTGHPDSGSVYVNVSNVAEVVTGADGAKGDKGDTGATGATGPTGPTGSSGALTALYFPPYTVHTGPANNLLLQQIIIPAGTFVGAGPILLINGFADQFIESDLPYTFRIYLGSTATYNPTTNHAIGKRNLPTDVSITRSTNIRKQLSMIEYFPGASQESFTFQVEDNYVNDRNSTTPSVDVFDQDGFKNTFTAGIDWDSDNYLQVVLDGGSTNDQFILHSLNITQMA